MKLGSQRHRVDHDWLLVRIVVEDHDIEQAPGSIRTDDQVPSLAGDHAERVAQNVIDVFIADGGLIEASDRRRRAEKWRRWERAAPMELWEFDLAAANAIERAGATM